MTNRLHFSLHILLTTVGNPGNVPQESGALRGVLVLLAGLAGLLSCGQLRENGDGDGGRTVARHS